MTTLYNFKDFDIQTLTDEVQGRFAQKNAFMGSALVKNGVAKVDGNMPASGPEIGETITVPYFGVLPKMVNNPDGSSITPNSIGMTNETATVARYSSAFDVSRWARGNAAGKDPYEEMTDQLEQTVEIAIDEILTAKAAGTPLIYDRYSATAPVMMSPQLAARARVKVWGDEASDGLGGWLMHSRTVLSLRLLQDGMGQPLLYESYVDGDNVMQFMGLPVIESDRAPIVGTMGTVVSVGTSTEPTLTLAGTPLDLFEVRIRKSNATTTLGVACLVQFSTDGGMNWSEDIAIPSTAAVAMTDTAVDSLVGVNGKTGLTMAFSGNFTGLDNVYGSNATGKVSSLLCKKDSLAFWFNNGALTMQTFHHIRSDVDEAAVHLYHAAHRYRRVPYGTKCGVLAIKHNVEVDDITTASLSALALS